MKEIIRDNLLFDERNPAMIVGDAPLEAALGNKKVHVNDIRSVVIRQLTMVEARQGPWNQALLLRGMTRLESMPTPSRPERQIAVTPASVPRARAISLIPMPAGAVVLHSPNSGAPRDSGTEVPARPLMLNNSVPGLQQEIGVVSYTFPARPAAAQSAGGAATANAAAGEGFTGVRIRPLVHRPGAARAPPPPSREAAASISQVIVTLTLLLANAGSADGFMAYSCENMKSPVVGYELTPQAGCWMRPPMNEGLRPKDGRILWMRDKAQFPIIHCKMRETVMQANCGSRNNVGPWKITAVEKMIPISPRDCLNISESGKVTLFGHTVTLTTNGTGMRTLEERVNCDAQRRSSTRRGSGGPGRSHIQLTVRRVAVWWTEDRGLFFL